MKQLYNVRLRHPVYTGNYQPQIRERTGPLPKVGEQRDIGQGISMMRQFYSNTKVKIINTLTRAQYSHIKKKRKTNTLQNFKIKK